MTRKIVSRYRITRNWKKRSRGTARCTARGCWTGLIASYTLLRIREFLNVVSYFTITWNSLWIDTSTEHRRMMYVAVTFVANYFVVTFWRCVWKRLKTWWESKWILGGFNLRCQFYWKLENLSATCELLIVDSTILKVNIQN